MEAYHELSKKFIDYVGGKENIVSVSHCLTRLRLSLRDFSVVEEKKIKGIKGVIKSQRSGAEYQIVIGTHVPDVCLEVQKILDDSDASPQAKHEENEGKQRILDRLISTLTKSMTPVLGVMSAAGLLQGIVALLIALNLLPNGSGELIIFRSMANTVLTFLPVFLGYTSAQTFKMNKFIGLFIGSSLVLPFLDTGLSDTSHVLYTLFSGSILETNIYHTFFGIPIMYPPGGYMSTVLPVIFAVYFASKVEKFLKKRIPDIVGFALVPCITMLIAFPVTMMVIGPISNFLGLLLTSAVTSLYGLSPIVSTIFICLIYQPLIVMGLHWPLMPIQLTNFAALGYDPVLVCIWVSTFTQFGAALAVYLRTKRSETKALCPPAMVSSLFHIMEPGIYGVTLPVKKRFAFAMLGGVAGGTLLTVLGARNYTLSGSILGVVGFINPNNGDISGLFSVLLSILVAIAVPFILIYLTFSEEPLVEVEETSTIDVKLSILSPMSGVIKPLIQGKDEIFSQGILGEGAIIVPNEGKVVAPCSGVITTLFPTKHAIGMTTPEGVEILIHIGKDTVHLDGKFFNTERKQGDFVRKGEDLLFFDLERIKAASYSLETPVIVTNSNGYSLSLIKDEGAINFGDELFGLSEKTASSVNEVLTVG